MKNIIKVVTLVLLSILVVGCATIQIPPELIYSKTIDEIANPAFIRGTYRKDPIPLFDGHKTFVYSIDGKIINDKKKPWTKDIPIEAGLRAITVEYNHGVYSSQAAFQLGVQSGKKYEIRSKEVYEGHVDFWIVDIAENKAVSGIARGTMGGGTSGTFVPIFIPSN